MVLSGFWRIGEWSSHPSLTLILLASLGMTDVGATRRIWQEPQPERVQLGASATFGAPAGRATLNVARAANVEVEDSPSLKFLRLRNGDFDMYKSVFLVIDGERHEITMDAQDVPRPNNRGLFVRQGERRTRWQA